MNEPESNDEDHWRARRLRKRIEQRRRGNEQPSAEQRKGKTHARKAMALRALQMEKANYSDVRRRLFDEEVENREVLMRVSQHIVIERLVHVFAEDMCSLSRQNKGNLDVLGGLEARVRTLRASNMHGESVRPWADRQVDMDLKVDLSRPNNALFAACSVCNGKILKRVLDSHERFCHGTPDSDDEGGGVGGGGQGDADGSTAAIAADSGGGPAEGMAKCEHCGRPFRKERLAKHEEACKKKMKAMGNRVGKEARARDAVTKKAPRPPRHFKVIGKTCDEVTFFWEPPIIDGGAPVFEHEISYSIKTVMKKDKYSKEEEIISSAEPVLTSRWCQAKPIAVRGFTLTGLSANLHLVALSVRCRNEVGWSDPTESIDEVVTEAATPPSVPLFFRVDTVKANQAVLCWKEPFFKGGQQVTEYELTYTDVLADASQAVTRRKLKVDRHHELRTPAGGGNEETLVLRDLHAATVHKDITLRAVGGSGMSGASATVPDFTTLPPGRRQRITDELRRARAATGAWIDTDFYKDFLQSSAGPRGNSERTKRENRDDYIAKLERDLASLPPESNAEKGKDDGNPSSQPAGEQQTAMVKLRSAQEEDDLKQQEELTESVFKGYKRRKAQFEYRLKRLHEQIEECEETRLAHIGNRAVLAQQLVTTQARVMEVQAELDRVATFKGGHVNSAVMHGSQQRFPIKVLRQKLRREFEMGQASIARDKADVMEGTKTSLGVMKLKLKREEELKERKAAFAVFNRNVARAQKLGSKLKLNESSDAAVTEKAFSALALAVNTIQRERAIVLNALRKMRLRLERAAFHKWKTGKHVSAETTEDTKYIIRGIGGRLLLDAEDERERVEKELKEVMRDAAALRRDFTRVGLTNSQKAELEGSTVFGETELGYVIENNEAAGLDMALLAQGDGFMKAGAHEKAAGVYSRQIEALGHQSDRTGLRALGMAHARLAKAQSVCDRTDLAAVSFERALELSTAAKHLPGMADALEGLGGCCLEFCQHRDATALFKRAQACNVEVKDRRRDARLYRALEDVHRRMVDEEHALVYATRAEAIEREMEEKVAKSKASLEDSHDRLVGRTADSAKVVELERVTAGYVVMCSRRDYLENNVAETIEAKKAQAKVVKKRDMRLQLIREQLKEAQESDKDAMSSTLIVEGELMSFEIEELKLRLRERESEVSLELTTDQDLLTAMTNRVTNAIDELEGLQQDIAIEGGALMARVVGRSRLRLIALNPANTAGNEVDGTATGGVEKVVAAEGKKVLVYGLEKGNLEHVFSGDEPGRHTGELLGHSGVITALFFYKHTVYTGSMDCTVQVWDVEERKRMMVLRGHEATVCSVVADEMKIVSGAADKEIVIWDPVDGSLLRILHGHTKSVVSLHSGASFILSGGADGDIRLWGIGKVSRSKKASSSRGEGTDGDGEIGRYECKRRLSGHYRSATCVSYGRLELVSGHEDGTVVVWWASTGLIMMKSKVHGGPVRQLQFDATKVVSCSTDGVIAVTDLTTGECTMTLRGHKGIVHAVAFDRSKIISASDDGTLRTWAWGTRGPKQDKYAVLGPGDNLGRLAKQHNTTVADMVKWNGIRDARQIGVGGRLIVKKGNPSEPTAAEAEAEQKNALDRRRAQTIERSRVQNRDAKGRGGVRTRHRPKGTQDPLDDPRSLTSRLARRDARFDEMWQEARRLETVSSGADAAGDRAMAGRVRERMRGITREAAAFDSDHSDHDGGQGSDSDSEENGKEDILVQQAKEREQAAIDVTGALLGAILNVMIKDIVTEAIASSAPRQGIIGRVNAFNATNLLALEAAPPAATTTSGQDPLTHDITTSLPDILPPSRQRQQQRPEDEDNPENSAAGAMMIAHRGSGSSTRNCKDKSIPVPQSRPSSPNRQNLNPGWSPRA